MTYKMKGFGGFGNSPAKHKPKSSGTWDATFGTKPEPDKHKHPHTEEVQATADHHKKGDARYKDAKSGYERAMSKGPTRDLGLKLDMHTRNEKRSLSHAESNPEYFKPTKKKNIKNPKYKKKSPVKQIIQEKNPSKQVPLSKHEEEKGTMITGGSKSEKIADLEDRIEFLRSDLKGGGEGKVNYMELGRQITKLEARLKKEKAK